MEPFQIKVDDAVLADLRERLQRTRWPDEVGSDWAYGTDLSYLKSLCDYWADGFDWRAQEAALNRFDQFTTQVDGRSLHFIHQRSVHEQARPLIITHGWPGSIVEFRAIIPMLTDPTAHGGSADDAFHVVCPSIPGYGFSEAPAEPGFSPASMADVNAQLMEQLGYDRYFAQGGDWGAIITSWLGARYPKHVRGIHLNMIVAGPPPGDNPFEGVPPDEAQSMARAAAFMKNETGYQRIQGTKPQTLGYGLHDSPVGLAGWIAEKFHGWTDHDGNLESAVSRDDLLTNITLYWVTGSITSSMRIYYEFRVAGAAGVPQKVEVPTGAALFPGELFLPPRRWAEQIYNITHWSKHSAGGHFAALEKPAELAEDIRLFCRGLD